MERNMSRLFAIGSGDLFWAVDKIGHFVGGTATAIAMSPLNALASGMQDAVGSMLVTLGTLWIRLNVPNVWDESTGTSETVAFLHSEVAPLVGLFAVGGIIIGAARLALAQRGQAASDLVQGIFILALVTGCGVPIIGMLISGADAWAQHIIGNSTNGTDFSRNVALMLEPAGAALAPVLVIFFGIVALLASVVQIMLMVARAALLVLLAGLLPVAAATSTTRSGREHLKKYMAWVLAFVIWKPLAALIYATAFRLIGTHELDATGAGHILVGVTMMWMAVLALPALMKFLASTTAALNAGGAAATGAASVAAMPSGAKVLRHAHWTSAAGAGVVAGAAGPSGARTAPAASPPASTAPATAPATGGRPRGTDGQ
jgi:type IV secretion system protein TrbL